MSRIGGVPVTTPDGRRVSVDARDLAAWCGVAKAPEAIDAEWRQRAEAYVAAHPRRASAGVAAAQRLAILRLLAAGPASTGEVLAAMRTVGYVGVSDLENRLRELRAGDRRAGAAQVGLALTSEGGLHRLDEPFPVLDGAERRALGFAKAMVGRLDGPLAAAASAALEHLVPGLAAGTGQRTTAAHRARAHDYQRFEEARVERRAVRVRYFSLNSGREGRYLLVPVEYVTLGATLKAVCVQVDPDGRRAEDLERQFALDRLLEVAAVEGQPRTPASQLRLRRSALVMDVSAALYEVLRQRNVFGLAEQAGEHLPYEDVWRVRGRFPLALAWDVMEQLCAWSGQAQVHEPLWLVNAVVRRLRAGLRVMEEGAAFTLVKPEPERAFADLGAAVRADAALPAPARPRKLSPPRRR